MFKQCLLSVAAATCLVVTPNATADSSTVTDPALSGWINEVLSQNPGLQAAQAAVEAAGGRLRAADQTLFNPELEIEYENSDTDTTAGGLSQTIDWADKRDARAAVADSAQVVANADLRSKRQGLATDLLRALALRIGTRPMQSYA
jgi:cobalt-zinc-cadmium efflux system outer membrane protein